MFRNGNLSNPFLKLFWQQISSTKENRDLPLKPLSISSKKKVLGFLEILDLIANKNLDISPPEITFDNGASF